MPNWRFYDNPMRGSLYTAPDILNVVRGPTLVLLRDAREPFQVPAMRKNMNAYRDKHQAREADEKTQLLKRILAGVDPEYRREQRVGRPQQHFERRPMDLAQPRPVAIS